MTAHPFPNGRPRDMLDDGQDVTDVEDRALVLRSVNATLAMEHAIGRLTGEVSRTREDIHDMRGDLHALHAAVVAAVNVAQGATTVASSHMDSFMGTVSCRATTAPSGGSVGSFLSQTQVAACGYVAGTLTCAGGGETFSFPAITSDTSVDSIAWEYSTSGCSGGNVCALVKGPTSGGVFDCEYSPASGTIAN